MTLGAFLALVTSLSLGFVIGVLGYVLSRLVTPRRSFPSKFQRFEAGNPPHGRARGWFAMQYYGYLIVFLTVEPIVIYMFLILMHLNASPIPSLLLFIILVLMLIPPMVFGLDLARKVKIWLIEE